MRLPQRGASVASTGACDALKRPEGYGVKAASAPKKQKLHPPESVWRNSRQGD